MLEAIRVARGPSLMDQHLQNNPSTKITAVPERFNRERDIGAKIQYKDATGRQKVLQDAKELDSKFTSGSRHFL